LKPEQDYVVFEKERNVSLTDEGISNVENSLDWKRVKPREMTFIPFMRQKIPIFCIILKLP
jgi:preprotein translocase subunit SecA